MTVGGKEKIGIAGTGAVSAAGWGIAALLDGCLGRVSIPTETLSREGGRRAVPVRRVPAPPEHYAWLGHARMRRVSPLSRYVVAAALEALGESRSHAVREGALELGIICAFMNGCVNYSNRFYAEVLNDPKLASPIVFPETVFNAPASHLAALLGVKGRNYTLVGDSGQFLPAMEVAVEWLSAGVVDACLVVAGEELDWLSGEAAQFFASRVTVGEGAGAVLLERGVPEVHVRALPSPQTYACRSRGEAARALRDALSGAELDEAVLVDGRRGIPRLDREESRAWQGWCGDVLSPATVFGEMMGAGLALQCVVAHQLVASGRYKHAVVSHVGSNQQAVGAWFERVMDA